MARESSAWSASALAFGLGLGLAGACDRKDDGACDRGELDCACEQGACSQGLECVDGLCVDPDDSSGDLAADNYAACVEYIETFNALPCVGDAQLDPAGVCEHYMDDSADCTAIFECYTANLACVNVDGVEEVNNYLEGCPSTCV